MNPLLQEQDGSSGTGGPVGDEGDFRGIDQAWVLGPVDEAGEVAVVPVGPARRLVAQRGQTAELADRLAGHIEDYVVRAS